MKWLFGSLLLCCYTIAVVCATLFYSERRASRVERAFEREMVRRADYERKHLDSIIVFIRESDSATYWRRVAEEIEYAKRIANEAR